MTLFSKEDWALTLSGMLKQAENNLADIVTLLGRLVEPKVMLRQDAVMLERITAEIAKRNKYLADVLEFDAS